ncbi:oxidoreductase [Mycobacterium montefiorense]|nr:oxidoreductase [Mycobacterium montefiorense]
MHGPVITADDPGYDEEVAVFNMAVRHRPAVVVGAANATDVSEAVRFAGSHNLNIAVLNTGHGPTVAADADTLMITTGRMSGLTIDAENLCAKVDAGVRFGRLVDAAAMYGLAPLPGSSPGVGVVGYTLGGGASSTMGRKYGWASDHVTGIDVVTADGQLRYVSAEYEADLFSALLGGKSNFGVVVAMKFALFPVTWLYAGALFYSGEHTRQVLDAYRELTASAPDELTTGFALLNFPPLPGLPPFMQGKLTVSVRVSYVGDAHVGAQLIDPLRTAAPMLADSVASIPYTQFATISNDPTDPAPAVEHFGLLRELNEDTAKAIVDTVGPDSGSTINIVDTVGPDSGSTINIVDIRHLQGAFSKPAPFPNAVGARDAAYAMFGLTVVPPGQDVATYRDSGRELLAALSPWLHDRSNPSFVGPADTPEDRTRQAYDPTVYEKLRTAKAIYDPYNRFRLNHNIPPIVAA